MLSPPSTPPLLREAGSCGGSSGRSASIGEGGCVPSLAACLGVLALPGAPDALQDAAARRLLDESDRALRADVLTRWCQTLRVSEGDAASSRVSLHLVS